MFLNYWDSFRRQLYAEVAAGYHHAIGCFENFFELIECLGRAEINIQLVSTSEIKIAVVIDEKDAEHAARLMHSEFGLARLMSAAAATQPLT